MQQPDSSKQRADVDGQGNITVQIVGERNQVTVTGAAALRLTMFPRRRKEGGDMGLLSAYTQSIDLVGREPPRARHDSFLTCPGPRSGATWSGRSFASTCCGLVGSSIMTSLSASSSVGTFTSHC